MISLRESNTCRTHLYVDKEENVRLIHADLHQSHTWLGFNSSWSSVRSSNRDSSYSVTWNGRTWPDSYFPSPNDEEVSR